jgi:hypothetical protein
VEGRRRKWGVALDDSEDLDKCELTELHASVGTGGSGLGDCERPRLDGLGICRESMMWTGNTGGR